MLQAPFTVKAVGVVTPGPVPCGGSDCRWVELDVIHAATCPTPPKEKK